jgi:hypothetical protein
MFCVIETQNAQLILMNFEQVVRTDFVRPINHIHFNVGDRTAKGERGFVMEIESQAVPALFSARSSVIQWIQCACNGELV